MVKRDVKIAPSILSADFAKLGEEVVTIDSAGADYIHIDVMDGNYVPNLTIGPAVIKAIRSYTRKPFDVHLMISNPQDFIEAYANAGADIITVHMESYHHLDGLLYSIRKLGKKAGVSLNPSTSEEGLKYVLEKIDMVLVMSVNPGFGGQEFIPEQLDKIRRLKDMIGARGIDIEVDGGITFDNAHECINAGADVIVAGTAVFNGMYKDNIEKLRCKI